MPTPAPNGRAPQGAQERAGEDAGQPRSGAELTIYIVEDSPPVRERLIEAVGDIPNARVVGQAETIEEALDGSAAALRAY